LGQKHGGNRARSMAIIQVGKKKKREEKRKIEERYGKKKK
jgi:hypothetical protein